MNSDQEEPEDAEDAQAVTFDSELPSIKAGDQGKGVFKNSLTFSRAYQIPHFAYLQALALYNCRHYIIHILGLNLPSFVVKTLESNH